MTDAAPALLASCARQVPGADPLVKFTSTGGGAWKVWDRFVTFRRDAVFEIGNICGTCGFWFRRIGPEAAPVAIDGLQARLTAGLRSLDEDVVGPFARLFQSGSYRVALFTIVPRRVQPGSADDYFSHEQLDVWLNYSHQEPTDPQTDYYRAWGRSETILTARGDRAFDFLVPLQRPETLDQERIAFFEDRLRQGAAPTAVAAGVLDIKQYYDSAIAHWCLSHYLLDGHHKVEAAARTARPLTLLSFIACDAGVSNSDDVDLLLANFRQETCTPNVF